MERKRKGLHLIAFKSVSQETNHKRKMLSPQECLASCPSAPMMATSYHSLCAGVEAHPSPHPTSSACSPFQGALGFS